MLLQGITSAHVIFQAFQEVFLPKLTRWLWPEKIYPLFMIRDPQDATFPLEIPFWLALLSCSYWSKKEISKRRFKSNNKSNHRSKYWSITTCREVNFGIKLGRFYENLSWYHRMVNWWRLLVVFYPGKLRFKRNSHWTQKSFTTHQHLSTNWNIGIQCPKVGGLDPSLIHWFTNPTKTLRGAFFFGAKVWVWSW